MNSFEIYNKCRVTHEGAEWLAEVLPPDTKISDVTIHHYTIDHISKILGMPSAFEHRETVYAMAERVTPRALGFDFFKIFREEHEDVYDIFYAYAILLPSPLPGGSEIIS